MWPRRRRGCVWGRRWWCAGGGPSQPKAPPEASCTTGAPKCEWPTGQQNAPALGMRPNRESSLLQVRGSRERRRVRNTNEIHGPPRIAARAFAAAAGPFDGRGRVDGARGQGGAKRGGARSRSRRGCKPGLGRRWRRWVFRCARVLLCGGRRLGLNAKHRADPRNGAPGGTATPRRGERRCNALISYS